MNNIIYNYSVFFWEVQVIKLVALSMSWKNEF